MNTPADRPKCVALARATASASSSKSSTIITGPKISSRTMAMSSWHWSKTVGVTKKPRASAPSVSRLPPISIRAPSALPRSMYDMTLRRCSSEMSEPTCVAGSAGSPMVIFSTRASRRLMNSCLIERWTNTRVAFEQTSPAE